MLGKTDDGREYYLAGQHRQKSAHDCKSRTKEQRRKASKQAEQITIIKRRERAEKSDKENLQHLELRSIPRHFGRQPPKEALTICTVMHLTTTDDHYHHVQL